ncbi:hypothetical protein NP493_1986g00001 [Ridgeia piscesae]|uniref:Methyltransferase type 11 domain-containing protein n=1 Tax=Ridgeia piscesae TaxID=27915 RepID=A0AAD9N4C2_RIDPI|nr:hypothetical protein NP493_1986g00001 [Ridgeia piscesae]
MSRFLRTRDDIDYTGIDIVPSLVDHHRKEYGRFGWKFIQRDVVQNGLNDTYDIIVCRMMLQHLYLSDVMRVLVAFSNSGSSYLLTTTFSDHPLNGDLRSTKAFRHRALNLEIEPVSLSTPLCIKRDGPPHSHCPYVGLWRLPLKTINQCGKPKPFHLEGSDVKFYSCAPWTSSSSILEVTYSNEKHLVTIL